MRQCAGVNPAGGEGLDDAAYPWLRRASGGRLPSAIGGSLLLHGPPGTGKTTTLGALLAQFLLQRPEGCVLLVVNTNEPRRWTWRCWLWTGNWSSAASARCASGSE
ncbi:MAG: AAA family ATPase [Paludibaculum sp.]